MFCFFFVFLLICICFNIFVTKWESLFTICHQNIQNFYKHVEIRVNSFFNEQHVMRCAIWYLLYNSKNVKNTHGGVLILVKLQVSACNFTKINTPPWVFFAFFKLYKWYQIAQRPTSIPSENIKDRGVQQCNKSDKCDNLFSQALPKNA